MNLQFEQKANGTFEAVFQATGDFNLHVDVASGKKIKSIYPEINVLRKNPEVEKYVIAHKVSQALIDSDFSALVYPVDIKVICNFEAMGIVTFA